MSKILIKLLIYGFIALANTAFANNDDSSETTTNQQPNDNKTMTEQANTTLPVVLMKTSLGDIEIQLNSDKAPATVTNFLNYVQSGHYDGTIFHRVIPGFMIQGGGFEQGMTQKSVNAPVLNEANNGLTNDTFTIAMARTSDPHSATAQFFINVNDNSSLNFSSETSRGWGYAVFGKVTKGDDIVKAIEAVSTGNAAGHADVPQEDVIITSVTVVK